MILRALAGGRPRIGVLRGPPGLGDLLCAVPSWRALRAAVPDAHVTLIGPGWTRIALERWPAYLDDHLAFPGYPGLPDVPEDPAATLRFLEAAQGRRFDLVIQQHGAGIVSNPLARLLGGARTAAFHLPGQYVPDPELAVLYPAHEHEIHRHLLLFAALGAPDRGDELEWPVLDADRAARAELAPDLEPSTYACLHPGAKEPARRWPAASFAAVGDALAAEGLRIVLTGVEGERDLAAAVTATMAAPALDLSGRTTLGSLGALLAGARVVICNDTGTSHLACAVGVPSVVLLFAPSSRTWAPLDAERHRGLWADRASDLAPAQVVAAAGDLLAAVAA